MCVLVGIPSTLHAASQAFFGGLGTDIREALGASSLSMGILAAAFSLPIVLFSPVAGLLVDRLGARRTLSSAMVGYGLGNAVFGLSTWLPGSIAARMAMGGCAAFLYPAFIAVALPLVPADRKQRVIGWMQLSVGLTAILASLATTRILATDTWRVSFWAMAALMVAMGAVLVRALAGPHPDRPGAAVRAMPTLSVRQALAIPDIRRACLVAFTTGGIMVAFGGLLTVTVARIVWKIPETDWGFLNASFYLAFALGGIGLVFATRRFGLPRTLRAMLLVLAGSLAALCYLPMSIGTPAACVMTFGLGLGASAMSLATTVAVRAVPVASAGVASSLTVAAMSFGGLVLQTGPMATSLIPESTPLGRAQGCAAVILALVFFAYGTARRINDTPA